MSQLGYNGIIMSTIVLSTVHYDALSIYNNERSNCYLRTANIFFIL